jgi:hypothetical protein
MFKSVNGGFQMTFANNLTVSVMFRSGNYCEHRDAPWELAANNVSENGFHGSNDAEIAIWEEGGSKRWINIGYDQVSGYHTPDQVAFIIFAVQSAKNFDDLQSNVKHYQDLNRYGTEIAPCITKCLEG